MSLSIYLPHLVTVLKLSATLFLLLSPMLFSLLFTARFLQVKKGA